MSKLILNKEDLQKHQEEAIKSIADVVKTTLGPGGNTILIERAGQATDGSPLPPKLTKDGVSVAVECSHPDKRVDVTMQAIKAVCQKTNEDAGDGTTTAIVLGQAIFEQAKLLGEELNPQALRSQIEATCEQVVFNLRKQSTPVKSSDMIRQIATISANGEQRVGQIISEAFDAVGSDGMVNVDEGAGSSVTLEKSDGYTIKQGAVQDQVFFNSKCGTKFTAYGDNDDNCVHVILYDGNINGITEIVKAIHIIGLVDQTTGSLDVRSLQSSLWRINSETTFFNSWQSRSKRLA